MNSCYKTSNNKYFKCPPMMSDGRHFTDYRPSCVVNNLANDKNNITGSYEYRQYLINNSLKLMNMNKMYACQKNCCSPCNTSLLEENTTKVCNKKSCVTVQNKKDGFGEGRQYSKLNSNNVVIDQPYNCCAKNNDLFNYYNQIDSKAQGEFIPRKTIPGGGNPLKGGDPDAFNM